jgi:RNA ligase
MALDLSDLLDAALLDAHLRDGYVRMQTHPELPLAILNYTEKAAYEGLWDDVTRQCRGLIVELVSHTERPVVARPFPKFFNHGEPSAPDLDLDAPAVVTDKLDGSLGILYPDDDRGWAIATRGSFTSEQALHATQVYIERYEQDALFEPAEGATYLFEIVYPENRIVCDYGDADDLFLLAVLDTATGLPLFESHEPGRWPGPRTEKHSYATLADALAAEPRPGAEGLVVYLPDRDERVKIKQDDYVALHRILTGTNARHVWEYAAVRACRDLVSEPKHWGSYLGIDPARAAQLLEVGDGWLDAAGIPDEFYAWIQAVVDEAEEKAGQAALAAFLLAGEAAKIEDHRARFELVHVRAGAFEREVMRLASAESGAASRAIEEIRLRAWREAAPEPSAPFHRSEAVS